MVDLRLRLSRRQRRSGAALPEGRRRATFVYIDEAQDYFDEGLEQLLNTARKYRVGLILAHQNLGQFDKRLQATVMSSTGIKFAGGVSSSDAKALAKEMHTTPEFIQQMQKSGSNTHFALYLRNRLPEAVEFRVPLGAFDRHPKMAEYEFRKLIAANRTRFCAPYAPELTSAAAGVSFDLEDQDAL